MQNNSNIPQGLPMEQLVKLANSPQGKALLAQLQQNHPEALQAAAQQAQAGNYDAVKKTMSEFMASPTGQALIQQLRGFGNG